LQRTIGNQAVQRLLEADTVTPKADTTTSEVAGFGHDFSRIPVFSTVPEKFHRRLGRHAEGDTRGPEVDSIAEKQIPSPRVPDSSGIQTKLAISTPGDRFEVEADAVADHAMRVPDPMVQRQCKGCPDASEPSQNHEEKRQIQRLANGEAGIDEVASNYTRRLGDGAPLDAASRSYFEPYFGHDFSNVRVHSDAKAAASARDVGALAYTVGPHLVFASGEYNPSSEAGRKLLAHELTHHVQQSAQMGRAAPACASTQGAEAEADRNAERVGTGAQAEVNVEAPVSVAMKGGQGDPAADRSYWFQSKPPEKPSSTESGIEITPKGQVFLDPSVSQVKSPSLGTFKVQFAGLDTDFRNGKPIAAFAAAKNAILEAITGAVGDLQTLPDIENAPSLKAAKAKREEDETVRARLKESARTLDGKTLNVFIATDLSVAEKMSKAPLSLRTEQIFVRADDLGDAKKLEAGIRVPLIALTGGEKGLAPGPGGTLTASNVTALDKEQAKEAILHEMVHVMLIGKGVSAGQVWQAAKAGMVTGPDEVKQLAEDVLFRYVRAQEEIFVYTAIGSVYSGFAANKDHYVDFMTLVEALLHDIGAKLEKPKTTKIDVKEKIGEGKKKQAVSWSIGYTLPKPMKLNATQVDALKVLQTFDIGS
jgi:hypothetical protein